MVKPINKASNKASMTTAIIKLGFVEESSSITIESSSVMDMKA